MDDDDDKNTKTKVCEQYLHVHSFKMGYISHQRTAITKRLWNDRLEQMNVEHPHAPEQTLIKTKKIKEHVVLYDFENDKQLARDYSGAVEHRENRSSSGGYGLVSWERRVYTHRR